MVRDGDLAGAAVEGAGLVIEADQRTGLVGGDAPYQGPGVEVAREVGGVAVLITQAPPDDRVIGCNLKPVVADPATRVSERAERLAAACWHGLPPGQEEPVNGLEGFPHCCRNIPTPGGLIPPLRWSPLR